MTINTIEGTKSRCRWLTEAVLRGIYPETALCAGCQSMAGVENPWFCPDCVRSLARSWVGAFPDRFLDGSAAAYEYRSPAGSAVRLLKYRGLKQLASAMADEMMRACRQIEPIGAEMVVPVPMHINRLRQRGFNHSELLAREVAVRLGVPCENGLERTRDTVQQVNLSWEERTTNLENAFEALPSVSGWRVLLVDDVFTTGHTAYECAKALRKGGALSVSFLAYAKSRRH